MVWIGTEKMSYPIARLNDNVTIFVADGGRNRVAMYRGLRDGSLVRSRTWLDGDIMLGWY